MKKTLLFITGTILSTLSFSQVIDQKLGLTLKQTESLQGFNKSYEFLQSFKAGKTGLLERVDLAILTTLTNKTVTASIYSGTVEGKNLSDLALGSSTKTIIANVDSTIFNFSGIEIVAGESYSIKITTTLSPQTFGIKGSRSSTYADGNFSAYLVSTKTYATDTEADMYFVTYVTEPTGVSTNQVANSYDIYPNPSNGSDLNFANELTNIVITNTFGEVIITSTESKNLNLSTLENGNYFLKSDQGFQKIQIIK